MRFRASIQGAAMKLAYVVFGLSLVAAALLLVAGPGTRLDLWQFGTGFQLMRWAAFLGLAVAVLSVVLLVLPRTRRDRRGPLVVALLIGLAVAFVPWNFMRQARAVPPIHDITTDTSDPPQFDAVLALRADAPNPATYRGPEVARLQREAYPDIGTHHSDAPPPEAFDEALTAAREMGWEIVAADPASGRIEATATTFWFGFKDDVAVRVGPDDSGSRVDVRSVSRVGRSDVGKNAERIRAYLALLED